MGRPVPIVLALLALSVTGARAADADGSASSMQAQMEQMRANVLARAAGTVDQGAGPAIERPQHGISEDDIASLVLPGVFSGATTRSFLRFSNADSHAVTATVQLRDPMSGEGLFNWTTPSIPVGGTYEIAVTEIIAKGTPIHRFHLPPVVIAEIVASFLGHVQHVAVNAAAGTINNVTTCGMVYMADALSMSYVSGPGRQGILGMLRVTNGSSAATSLRMTFLDSAGHASVWTTPSIAPMGSYALGIGDIGVQAKPPIGGDVTSLMVVADPAPYGVTMSYSEGLAGATVLDDFSAACMFTDLDGGPGMSMPGHTGAPTPTTPAGSLGGDPGTMDMCGMDMSMCMMMNAPAPTEP